MGILIACLADKTVCTPGAAADADRSTHSAAASALSSTDQTGAAVHVVAALVRLIQAGPADPLSKGDGDREGALRDADGVGAAVQGGSTASTFVEMGLCGAAWASSQRSQTEGERGRSGKVHDPAASNGNASCET